MNSHKPNIEDKPTDDEPDPDQSYLIHVPRVQQIIQTHGIIHVPNSVIERMSAMGIPNSHGESQLGHSDLLTCMTDEVTEELGRWSSIRKLQGDTRDLIVTAAFLHDIGKLGPPPSVNPDPIPFIKFYNVDFPNGSQKIKLKTALAKAVAMGELTSDERLYIELTLKTYGLDPDRMFLRTFYNLHSLFTYDTLRECGIPEDIAAAASGHHLKRGIKPDHYSFADLAETGSHYEYLDELAAMVRSNNERTRHLSIRDRIKLVYGPFETLPKPISSLYCGRMGVTIASGVLQQVMERHPQQIR